MRPELFHFTLPLIGTIPIYTYGFMIMLGLLVALFVASRRARAMGIDPAALTDLAVYAMVGGIVGARIFYVAQFHDDFDWRLFRLDAATFTSLGGIAGLLAGGVGGLWLARNRMGAFGRRRWVTAASTTILGLVGARLLHGFTHPSEVDFGVFRIDKGGLVFFGGFFVAFVVCLLYVRSHRLPVGRVADVVAPSLILGQAFGRIGCFLQGCCFGKTCSLPWAVTFPSGYHGAREIPSPVFDYQVRHMGLDAHAATSLPVHPTQVYSSLFDFGLFLFLSWWLTRRRLDGDVMLLYGILYSAGRFGLEFLRGDNDATFTGLTIAQDLSIVIFVACTVWYVARRAVAVGVIPSPQASGGRA
ncbi:MAG: prolipoprotein diacylglyceryl transferase [Planctomycetes bacterium]|nr:prolipoprotein diacylglyceryl transferase [Planctomycetota bacterium]MBI3844463.1 prolipoprotein diacylglyceryl transferase [Planctomycetota bacterium]